MDSKVQITPQELNSLGADSYQLIDIRDAYSYEYGHIPGAMGIPADELMERLPSFPPGKLLVLCCRSGSLSLDMAEALCGEGYSAASLAGGYYGWLRTHFDGADKSAKAEQSIRKTFHKELWSRFAKAVRDYELVKPHDKIAVCMSGGKDSMLMAKLFQELKWHNKFEFDLVFLVMDPGYSPENRELIEHNARSLNIPVTIFETDIFEAVSGVEKSPCYLCARMRRGHLYRQAMDLGCNKIALGHHYDDVIETVLMGMLYGGQFQAMMPKLHSTNFPGMELIRPMYLIREADVIRWRDYNDLCFLQCACRFTESCSASGAGHTGSKRAETKALIQELKKTDPNVEANIFRSTYNVNLNTVLAYKDDSGTHSFLEHYDVKGDIS